MREEDAREEDTWGEDVREEEVMVGTRFADDVDTFPVDCKVVLLQMFTIDRVIGFGPLSRRFRLAGASFVMALLEHFLGYVGPRASLDRCVILGVNKGGTGGEGSSPTLLKRVIFSWRIASMVAWVIFGSAYPRIPSGNNAR